MEWQKYFNERILERGYAYYMTDAVKAIKKTPKMITATVTGMHDYDVTISLDDHGDIQEMFCDCPFANNGNPCKHMAAVLYASDDVDVEIDPIDEMDLDTLRDYVRQLRQQDDKNEDVTDTLSLPEETNNKADYIDKCLDEIYRVLMDNQLSGFKLSQLLVERFDFNDFDTVQYRRLEAMWQLLIEHSDDEVLETMYQYMFAHFHDEGYGESYKGLLTLMKGHYKQLLAEFNLEVLRHERLDDIISVLSLMEEHEDLTTISRFAHHYYDHYRVREWLMNYCIRYSGQEGGEAIFKENLTIDQDNYHYKDDLELLRNYYNVRHENDKEREVLLELMKDMGQLDHYYDQLRYSFTADQWQTVREDYLKKMPRNEATAMIFKAEGYYEGLIDYVTHTSGLRALSRYQNVLAQNYSAQLLKKYAIELDLMMSHARYKEAYEQVIQLMRPMLVLSGGQEVACALIKDWKTTYKRRHLMIELLDRFINETGGLS